MATPVPSGDIAAFMSLLLAAASRGECRGVWVSWWVRKVSERGVWTSCWVPMAHETRVWPRLQVEICQDSRHQTPLTSCSCWKARCTSPQARTTAGSIGRSSPGSYRALGCLHTCRGGAERLVREQHESRVVRECQGVRMRGGGNSAATRRFVWQHSTPPTQWGVAGSLRLQSYVGHGQSCQDLPWRTSRGPAGYGTAGEGKKHAPSPLPHPSWPKFYAHLGRGSYG